MSLFYYLKRYNICYLYSGRARLPFPLELLIACLIVSFRIVFNLPFMRHPSMWGHTKSDCDLFVRFWRNIPQWARTSSFARFLDHTQRRTTAGRTSLDEWLARRRDLYLTTHNTHNRQTSMPPVGFEPTISPGVPPQTYALDCSATGTGSDCGSAMK